MPPKKNLLGNRFDRLVVVSEQPSRNNKVRWLCKCDCGNETIVSASQLRTRKTKSCGCKRTDNEYLTSRRISATKRLWNIYRRNAKIRKYDFRLSLDKVSKLVSDKCFYCGSSPANTLKHHGIEFVYNGIDRLDNSKGYTSKNVVTCCGVCNRMKMNMDYMDFIKQVERINVKRET